METITKEYKHPLFTATFTNKDGYYSLTGHIAERFGAIGEYIIEVAPEFRLLESLHLTRVTNIPVEVEKDLFDTLKALEIHEVDNPDNTYTGIELTVFPEEWDNDELDRVSALAKHLNCPAEWVTRYGEGFNAMGSAYLVLTDAEAEQEMDKELDYYIDEVLEIPDSIRPYFDEDRWKQDAAQLDGRGHVLNRYDGCEYEETGDISGEPYFIYHQ